MHPPERMKDLFRRKIIALPSDIVEASSTSDILADLTSLLTKYIDLGQFELQLIAHYVLLTWVWQRFGSFGLLGFQGVPGSGKTRCLDVLKRITYRGTDTGVNISKANLARMSDKIAGTLLVDEADRPDADFRSGFIQVMNASYRRDGVVPILEQTGDSWNSITLPVGGPKIVTHRADFDDRALMSRFFTLPMVLKKTSIPTHLPDEFEAEMLAMRNRLLAWRLENRHKIQLDSSKLGPLNPRSREIGTSLYSISPDEAFRSSLIEYLHARDVELATDDPLQVILEAVAAFRPRKDEKQSAVSLKDIQAKASSIAEGRNIPAWELSNKRVAAACRSLRFKTKHERDGTKVFISSDVLNEQLKRCKV